MHYLEVPTSIIKKLGGKFRGRYICTVNGGLNFSCGLVALGQGRGYISITKRRLKEINLAAGDRAAVVLTPDTSKYGMVVPEELKAVLKQDPQGKKRFDGLSPGRQRYILNYVGSVKNSDKRIERALLLIENLKLLPVGKESFAKMLGKKS